MPKGMGSPNDSSIKSKFSRDVPFFSQFVGAELMSVKYGVTRLEMDAFASRSHQRATDATVAGRFKDEIVPLKGHTKEGVEFLFDKDEGIRTGTTVEKLGALDTLVKMGMMKPVEGGKIEGTITAGNASQISE